LALFAPTTLFGKKKKVSDGTRYMIVATISQNTPLLIYDFSYAQQEA
jgi:hypothetical protein